MRSVQSQGKAFGTMSRIGNFQAGEDIFGELTFGSLRPFASLGIPLELNRSLPEILPHMLVIDIISHRQELVEVT